MEQRQSIIHIASNDTIAEVYLLSSANQMQAKNGPFWRLELRDATGSVDAKIWFPTSQNYPDLAAGQIVYIEGKASTYRDKIDININHLHILTDAEMANLDLADFLPASARPAEEMLFELEDLCNKVFTHKPWRKFALSVLRDKSIRPALLVCPAAKAMHHAFVGGLVEHMLSVTQLCQKLADHYPKLDRQVLTAGAIFHDIGKIWELTGGLTNDYTDEGRLLGHIHMGLERITPHLTKSGLEPALALHFKHLMLSHHGEYEFGSPKRPKTVEAMILHYADNIDAKMEQMQALFRSMPEGESGWSPYQSMYQRFMYQPERTPQAPVQAEIGEPSSKSSRKRELVESELKLPM